MAALLLFSMSRLPGNIIDAPGPKEKSMTSTNCSTPRAASKPKVATAGHRRAHDARYERISGGQAKPGERPNAAWVISPVVTKFICACVLAKVILLPPV